MKTLTSLQRKELRARAHALHPVVMISDGGLSAGVTAEIERALQSHELVKIRIFSADRDQRESLLGKICATSDAQPVQHIGKILVIYRKRPEQKAPRTATASRPDRRPPRKSTGPGKHPASPAQRAGPGARATRPTTRSSRRVSKASSRLR